MPNQNKYNSKAEKLKAYSKKKIYKKIRPSFVAKNIPNDFITEDGYTKEQLMRDVYKLVDCNNKISYIDQDVKVFDKKENKHKVESKGKQFDSNQCNIFTLCPICSEKHATRLRKKYKEEIKALTEQYPYTYMITFTVRDEPTFNLAYDSLTEGVRKYVLMGQLRGHDSEGKEIHSQGEASKIKAMALGKEIIMGKRSGMWHLHAHAIAFADSEIDFSVYDNEKKWQLINDYKDKHGKRPKKDVLVPAINEYAEMELINEYGEIEVKKVAVSKASKEWIKATGGLSSDIHFNIMEGTPNQIFEQCIEVMKYTSKIEDMEPGNILEVLANRKGKRFFATYGELYNVKNPDKEESEEIENTDLNGFVWNSKDEKMVPMDARQKQFLNLKYEKMDEYYKAKSVVMKAWYIKEEIKKDVVKSFNVAMSETERIQKVISSLKPGKIRMIYENDLNENLKCVPGIRKIYVNRIDELENVYIHYKKTAFKMFMGLKLRDKDKFITSHMNVDQLNFFNSARPMLKTNN